MTPPLRILNLEDDPQDSELARRALKKEGLDCDMLRLDTREQFVAELETNSYDLVISDYSLPGFNGLEAMRIAKEKQPNLPFIFLSGTMGEDVAVETLKQGACDYVLKDRLARLGSSVKHALDEAREHEERLRAEKKVKEAKEEWERTFDAITDPIMILDKKHRIIRANKAMASSLGLTPRETVGLTCYEVVHGADKPPEACPYARLLREGTPQSAEVRSDGMGGYFLVSVSPLFAPGGTLYGSIHYARNITERKRAEEKLARSEARLREAQRIAHIGNWELDLVNNVLLWSDEAYRIFEIDPGQFTASYEAFLEKIHPEDREAVNAAYTGSVKDRVPYNIDHRLLLPGGRIKYVNEQCETVYDADNTPLRSVGTIQDITARKKTEEELKFKNLVLGTQQDASLDGILVVDDKGTMVSFNQRFVSMWGIPPEIARSRSAERALLSAAGKMADPEKFLAGVKYLYSHPAATSHDELELKDGRSIDRYSAPMIGPDGKYFGRVWYFRDISKNKQAERALQESEQRFKTLVESATDYIYTVQVESGRPVSTVHGPGCVTVTGYSPADYGADPLLWQKMIYEEDRPAVMGQAANVLSGAQVKPLEHRITHKDGSVRWIKNTPVPRYDEHGRLRTYDGLISDITERKKLEEQLRQSQKLEAIGQLAGGIAHDFNNILSAIIGYGSVLLMKMPSADALRINVEHLLESAERATQLTHSLLAFSRKQIMNLRPLRLNEVVTRVETLLHRVIGEDLELATELRSDAAVMADSTQIEQVLMNLATNARDAMPDGGRLAIATDEIAVSEPEAHARGIGAAGRYVVLSVSDSGVGMDEATAKRIFEPFFTTKEVGRGTGLGLSLVHGIVSQHRGSISVMSEPGKGTTFSIYLPVVDAGIGLEKRPAALPEALLPGGSETILLAEDDETVRKLSRTVLEDFGYTVIEAGDGEEAVSKFLENKERIGLIILDLIMPKKGGKEAYGEIVKAKPSVRALFASGYTSDKIYSPDLPETGVELVPKPISPSALLKKVRQVLDKAR